MKSFLTLALIAMLSTAALAADGPIKHVVSFKFKPDASAEAIHQVEADFAALKGKIPVVQSLEWGTNVSPEKHDKGFTHCWIATFKNAADRDAYLVDPAHKAFAGSLKGIIDDVFVIDFVPHE